MAFPRNINIQQDPLGQALDMFSQTFHDGISSAIEQRGIRERRDIEQHDNKTISAMKVLVEQMANADAETGSKIFSQFNQINKTTSPRLNEFGQVIGSYLKDTLENKREASLKVLKMNKTLEDLGKAIKNGDETGYDNATSIALSIEKNQLDELRDIRDNTFNPAITQAISEFDKLEAIRKVKIGLRGFDTDLETPGIQYGEDVGDFTQTMLKSVERTVAENPEQALNMLLTRVPTSEQEDVEAEKIINKALVERGEQLKENQINEDMSIFIQLEKNMVLDRRRIGGLDKDFLKEYGTDIKPISASSNKFTYKSVFELKDDIGTRIMNLIKEGEMDDVYDNPKELVDKVMNLGSDKDVILKKFDFHTGIDSESQRVGGREQEAFYDLIKMYKHAEETLKRMSSIKSAAISSEDIDQGSAFTS